MKTALPWSLIAVLALAPGCGKDKEKPAEQPVEQKTEAAQPVTISISCGSVAIEGELCKSATAAWSQKTGHKVNIVSTPNEPDDRLTLYQQNLASKSPNIDVYQIDVIWPGILANHFVDLKQYSGGAEKEHFEAIVQNNTVGGKLVGMPWFTDAGVLYYRKDLLEKHGAQVPTTWAELAATARKIQDAERKAGNKEMWGFVWQGKAYEGLTCDALEWVASHGGGTIVEPDGTISIDNPRAAAALDMAASWVKTITPQGVLSYAEEESRSVFQLGNAVFMRNWPYAWALAQVDDSKIKDKVGVTALPKGGEEGRHAAALGGWQLAVSRYSRHPEIAADLVMYLTGAAEQKRRAVEGAFNPTIASVYQDAEVLAKNPFFGQLLDTFTSAVPRPSSATGSMYSQVSREFYEAVHSVLSGKAKGADAVKALAAKLDEVSEGGEWK
jgi:trehalose/maltose transport system substrate-binding protein